MNALTTLPADAEAALTADRDEVKYRLPAGGADRLKTALSRRLQRHWSASASRDPRCDRTLFVTTVYFDTSARHQFLAQRQLDIADLKLRAREYCDPHPQPILWLELKYRAGIRTGKRRLGIPKHQVPRFFGHGQITPEMIQIQQAVHGPAAEHVLREMAAYCARFPQPITADCLVNYRRIAWQDAAGGLRVTMDLDLAFFRPPPDLWASGRSLMRHHLGPAVGQELAGLVEVKSQGRAPAWLVDLLTACGAVPVTYSKFDAASRAVHR